TPVDGQSLPALLPPGWSPLEAFWVHTSNPPLAPGSALVQLWGELVPRAMAALVRWNESAVASEEVEHLQGRIGMSLTVSIPASGAYAVVVGDSAPLPVPPAPVPGEDLEGVTLFSVDTSNLSGEGEVSPASSAANRDPRLVTA